MNGRFNEAAGDVDCSCKKVRQRTRDAMLRKANAGRVTGLFGYDNVDASVGDAQGIGGACSDVWLDTGQSATLGGDCEWGRTRAERCGCWRAHVDGLDRVITTFIATVPAVTLSDKFRELTARPPVLTFDMRNLVTSSTNAPTMISTMVNSFSPNSTYRSGLPNDNDPC